jgi:hypothetical protein
MRKVILLLICIGIFCCKGFAQKDSNYIVQFEKPYNVQLNSWVNNFDFFINPPRFTNSQQLLKLSPNSSWQTGLSLGLKFVTIAFGVQVPYTNRDETTFGRTRFYDFSFSYYQSRSGGEVYSRSFSGIYRSTGGIDTSISKLPDANIQMHGLTLYYNFNHRKFSYRSALSMAEFQKKSSGAFLLMMNLGYRKIDSPQPLIPSDIDSVKNYGELTGMRSLSMTHLNIRPGYAYNFCLKGGTWFVSPSAFAGLGIASYHIKSTTENSNGYSPEIDAHAKLSIGRNGQKYFFNVFATYDANLNMFGYPNFVAFQSTSFGFNAGFRFHKLIPAIKWL